MENRKTLFTAQLLKWYANSSRPLPWKGEKNPYLIWLSEIILQQTRVEQGLQYFEKFKQRFPKIEDLANAPEDEVMKLWEGLGYYSRARNLHFTAKYIAKDLNGVFPDTYQDILKLKGVGPYTAAAIASFAYGLSYAVVDGNVYRVLSRYFGIETPIDSTKGKKLFKDLAAELIDASQPGNYNQAIMDFGATHCLPQKPRCSNCLLASNCQALKMGRVQNLPIKSKSIKKRTRYFNYLVVNSGKYTLLNKRTQKDIWQNLYEFPLIESSAIIEDFSHLKKQNLFKMHFEEHSITFLKASKPFKQLLTHQKIIARFWEVELSNLENLSFLKVEKQNLSKFAFPKCIDLYLNDKSLTLELI